MDDEQSSLRPGQRLDRYELLCPIASGGMARVWLARLRGKRGFEKLVAVKTIRTELVSDDRFEAMFLDEARIASGIQHPNVAQIIDLGEQDDVLYLVMEWVDGDSLAKIRRLAAKRGHPLPLAISLRIMADTCAGLHAAHELRDGKGETLGVVHRDVSPQNILVAGSGAVKVIDFGVAKARNRGAGETGTGVVKGKIHYMAPEQAQGHAVDRRVDIWAVGVCLHELVTGKRLFDDDSEVEVLRRLMSEGAVPRIEGVAVPEAIDAILAHSLARNPDERFATAAAMQRALETAIDELDLTSTSEDVAEFVRTSVPDLATKRQRVVAEALADAEARLARQGPGSEPSLSGNDREDLAFAPTVVSERAPKRSPAQEEPTVALVKRKPPRDPSIEATPSSRPAEARPLPDEESKLTLRRAALSTDDEDIRAAGLPRRRWMWLVALGVVVGGAWLAWKNDGVATVRSWLGWTPAASVTQPEPSAAPKIAVVDAGAVLVVPTVAASSSATVAASSRGIDAGGRPDPSRPKHAPFVIPPVQTAPTAAATEAPTPPTATAAEPTPPPPTATTSDKPPDNPYTGIPE